MTRIYKCNRICRTRTSYGAHGLWIPDETRYAQISQGMLLSGDWVSPHFMGLRYFEKPIAGYWMIALSQAIFGDSLFGVRFVSALSCTLSVVLCYLIAWRLWRERRNELRLGRGRR